MEEEKKVEEILPKKEETVSKEDYLILKRSNEKKKATIVVLVFAMILILAVAVLFYLTLCNEGQTDDGNNLANNGSANTNKENYKNTFVYSDNGSYGIAYVTGYVKVIKEANCGSDICPADEPTHDIINFYVTDTESNDLKKQISSWYGDKYNQNMPIKLGCLENDIITYYNAADAWYDSTNTSDEISTRYTKTFTLDKNVTTKLLNSNVNNTITLKLEKFQLTHGGEAFSCYSHFSGIEVVEK